MKLGVICDGISHDLAHCVNVMDEFDLEYAELQFVGEHEGRRSFNCRDKKKLICCYVTEASLYPVLAGIFLPACQKQIPPEIRFIHAIWMP